MDLKKVAIIKPARGNYDAGTIYTYHSETWECVTGVLGDAGLAALGGGLAGAAARATGATLGGPWGFAAVVAGFALVGALNGYADHC